MGLFQRIFGARQTHAPEGGSSLSRMIFAPAKAGIAVNEDVAMTYSAVFACVRIISETISGLAWHVYERDGKSRRALPEHPADVLLHRIPNEEMTATCFRETMIAHALTWGNGYAEIEREGSRPVALWPITPDRVTPTRNEAGRLVYEVRNPKGGAPTVLPADDVFHLKGLAYDGLVGYSPIQLAKQAVSLGLAAEQFGATFFGNGAHPQGVLTSPEKLSDTAVKHLRETWTRRFGRGNSNSPAILEEGLDWKQLTVPPEAAQFLETRKFQVNEIARWFRVPPHKLADLERATFSNIEHQSREFVVDSIVPWSCRLEQEADRKLVAPSERGRLFTRIRTNGLMRGDTKTRAAFYRIMTDIGAMSPNDVRTAEDMNPVEGGDVYSIQVNRQPLGADMEEGEQEESKTGSVNTTGLKKASARVFADIVARLVHAECKASKSKAEKCDADSFAEWAGSWYAAFRQRIASELDAAAICMAELIGGGTISASVAKMVRGAVSAYAGQHVETSRASLLAAYPDIDAECERWEIERAAEAATTLTEWISTTTLTAIAEASHDN